jgi:hypothetical protein
MKDLRSCEGDKHTQIIYDHQILQAENSIKNTHTSSDVEAKRKVNHHFNLFKNIQLNRFFLIEII